MCVLVLSCVRLFVTPPSVALQAPQSMGFSRQEYWSGLPFPSSGDLPDPGMQTRSPALQADSLPSEPQCRVVFDSGSLESKEMMKGNLYLFSAKAISPSF